LAGRIVCAATTDRREVQEVKQTMAGNGPLALQPIGHVENGIPPGERVTWENIESRVVIEDQWAEGLEGLAEFSHVVILFWLDRPHDKKTPLKVHPEAKEDMPLVGLFATRTPLRPNPIGMTTVELLRVEDNTLHVRGLDAFDETPVLDIKPYLIRGDLKSDATVPDWLHQLWERHDSST
jgi:tRNA-Thr(GGU) m(6)t(6)A37 methyltransferase TsaA